MIHKRKLTRKSQLKFGKYADFTVGQMLDMHKRMYLRWVYYNCSQIDFDDDVLETLRIFERIEKPGKSPEMYGKINKEIQGRGPLIHGFKAKSKLSKQHKLSEHKVCSPRRNVLTSGQLQAKNHGR